MEGRYITNSVITEYVDGLYTPASDALAQLRQEAEDGNLPIILKDTERTLAMLLLMNRPTRILEIGTLIGYSACFFAAVCGPDTEIVTMERDPEYVKKAEKNINLLGYQEQIRIVEGDARDTLQDLDGIFDFVFIDAAKSHYREYWDKILPFCRAGSLIVCDNVLMRGSVVSEQYDSVPRRHRTSIRRMRAFLEHITGTDEADTAVTTVGDGLSISLIRGKGLQNEKN